MSNTATRLITLLMMMQRQPHQKAADLAAALGISTRSLHRYIGMLEEMGIPVCSERGPQGGFSLVRGYRMPPLVFTPQEAVALYLGTSLVEEMWGQLYEEAARGALAKLENVLPQEQQYEVAWARRALLATGMHRTEQLPLAPHLEKLRRAVRERRRVCMIYQGRSQTEPVQRDVDTYALIHRWGWWYAIGYCHLREETRSFRIDRIITLTLLSDTFSLPEAFDVHEYLATEPQYQPTIQVRMRFTAEGAWLARDGRSYWQSMHTQEDGSVIVTFEMPELQAATAMALSYGSLAEVLEPASVRNMVYEQACAIASKHSP